MESPPFCIRPMVPAEIDLAVEWAAAEGWNPGRNDAICYPLADPAGFLLGSLDGQPIATISVVRYGPSFGFLGFYIVKPEFRGQGYGLQLWKAGLAYLQGCTVGLDGVLDQQDNYLKSGFVLGWRNIRFEGVSSSAASIDPGVVPLQSLSFGQVAGFERDFFPVERHAFLRGWISQPEARALGLVEADRLCGHGVIRPSRNGWKIGPLHAESEAGAERLFAALCDSVPAGEAVFLDVPEPNKAALALTERHAMRPSFETARMYAGPAPELPLTRMFGVTSLEIG